MYKEECVKNVKLV